MTVISNHLGLLGGSGGIDNILWVFKIENIFPTGGEGGINLHI